MKHDGYLLYLKDIVQIYNKNTMEYIMSTTQLSGLTRDAAFRIGETQNSWRGAMAIWKLLEKKYLPPYYPEWAVDLNGSYTRTLSSETMKPIWDLVNSDKVSFMDKVVLCTTFDWVLVRRENINVVLEAFGNFEGETSLKEQAEIIQAAIQEYPKIVAIGWNQTSVNQDNWLDYYYEEENDERISYNLEKDKKHWFLFDDLKLE